MKMMDEIWKVFSYESEQETVNPDHSPQQLPPLPNSPNRTTASSQEMVQSRPLSPRNSRSKPSKAAVEDALALARRKRQTSPTSNPQQSSFLGSFSSITCTSSEGRASSHAESRNDRPQRIRHSEDSVHSTNNCNGAQDSPLKQQQQHLEAAMLEPLSHPEGSSQIRKNCLSPTSLNARAQEIILEARSASSHLSSNGGYSHLAETLIPRDLVQRALDNAAIRSKAAYAEERDRVQRVAEASLKTEDIPKLRSTKEVLMLASGVLKQTPKGSTSQSYQSPPQSPRKENSCVSQSNRCLSPSESDIGSIDDYEQAVQRLPSKLEESAKLPREKILQRIDGIVTSPAISPAHSPISSRCASPAVSTIEEDYSIQADASIKSVNDEKIKETKAVAVKSTIVAKPKEIRNPSESQKTQPDSPYGGFNILGYFWGGSKEEPSRSDADGGDSMAPMSCGSRRIKIEDELPAMATSLVRVMSDPLPPSYTEAVNAMEVDPRMPAWIENQFASQAELPLDGSYQLGASRTVIVHEIQRGNWTWCTEWSPDGNRLAVGTENHHLAVIDTKSSSVWRVRHDKRISGPVKNGTTHSIRSIAWGSQFIAIGGTGNAVSILAPTEPYPILHTIKNTGFVGSLHWLKGTNTLVIGSRLGKAIVVKIWARDEAIERTNGSLHPHQSIRDIQSTIVHTIDRQKVWVNAVRFSPGGKALAVGDGKGILGIYSYEQQPKSPVKIRNLANFKLEDSILDIEWSPDGQWLYAGGEDFAVTVINTTWWEAVHRIKRDRWVQFISSSYGGSHIAVGGVSSEVSILEVDKGWDTAINVSLKGLVPLSAAWHPQDQYLVLTGQNNSILAVETTNARYVSGHFLRSVSPILAIEFSPDGRMAAIGNEAGIITIFKLSGTTFITTYELVLDCDGSLKLQWSLNGAFLAIVGGNKLVIVARTKSQAIPKSAPPNVSGFFVAKVIRDLGKVHAVALDPQSHFVSVCGTKTRILDATANFKCVREMENSGITLASSWSPDGSWLAIIGRDQNLKIYDTASERIADWRVVFTVQTKQAGLALAWGPMVVGGLQYCAYGGEDKEIYIMEIRTKERTWETVLGIPRDGIIHDLDWNSEGLVAAAIGNGTVTVLDLSYLNSGWAVNEMDYNWQRQALTCFTELRRNRGKNCMRTVRWIPSAPGSDCLLAVGGTDGELEIVDLTERTRCSGYAKVASKI